MTSRPLVMALDQGTTSSRAIVFDTRAEIVAVAQQEFPQIYPADGWVEHDPEIIWQSTLATARRALERAEQGGGTVVAIGIANQRETTIVWERATERSIHNAIVWQDRRTAEACRDLEAGGHLAFVRERTGLLLDPYFSATKIAWILDHVENARGRALMGELAFGTVDSFLLWRLTGGRVHATDATNASRTNLLDIHTGDWSDELCRVFDVPPAVLPAIRDCGADFGHTSPDLFGRPISILSMLGDQQAASVGQACFDAGDVKATFGTGAFVLVNTGAMPLRSAHRLLTTVALRLDGQTTYALEGSIFVAGAAVQWLRDGLGIIRDATETEGLAQSLSGNGGVYMVPAFAGLGAPHWDPDARGALFGLTRATGVAELARAALESVCYQMHDLLAAIEKDGLSLGALRVDGGFSTNAWALHFLADIVNRAVDRPKLLETTALGAAYVAGRQAGVFGDFDSFRALTRQRQRFVPRMADAERRQLLAGWENALRRTLSRAPS